MTSRFDLIDKAQSGRRVQYSLVENSFQFQVRAQRLLAVPGLLRSDRNYRQVSTYWTQLSHRSETQWQPALIVADPTS